MKCQLNIFIVSGDSSSRGACLLRGEWKIISNLVVSLATVWHRAPWSGCMISDVRGEMVIKSLKV